MLTDTKIKTAKPKDKAYRLPDQQGLFVHVTPAGGKHWRMRYEFGGKEKLLSFGPYPEVSLLDARKERDIARQSLRQGRDPAMDRRITRAHQVALLETSFETIARSWWERSDPQWTRTHSKDVLGSLERDVFPAIGRLPISSITAPIVLAVLHEIERPPRSAIETAHRTRQRISAVFSHAIAQGLATQDPAHIVQKALKPIQRGQQPSITDLNGAREVLRRVESLESHPVTKMAMRLLALTATRPGELRAAEWKEFDLQAAVWTIPEEKTKMSREHVVPLAPETIDLLNVLRPFSSQSGLLFPNVRRPSVPMSENALGYALNRAGYHARHVPHGWRATFSTVMNERFPQDRAVIDLMLAHIPKDRVEGAYNRALHMPRRRELAEAWAKLILEDQAEIRDVISGPRR